MKGDLILTKSVSRFARNTVDSLTTVRKLKEKGVEVYFEKENIYTLDSKGELLITIMSSLAQEARNISDNTARGQRKRFADGKMSLGYFHFLGYKKGAVDGEMEIIEEEAVIVRRIYTEFLAGKSTYDIAARLTEDGIPTPAKKTTWHSSTVESILHNEKYMGDCLFQKTFNIDPITHKSIPNRGQLPQYYLEDCVPAIVSKEVWNLAQLEIQRRQTWKPMSSAELPFKNRIVCGSCGSGVVQYYAKRKGGTLDTMWRCGSWRKGKAKGEGLSLCAQIKIPLDAPEKAFVRAWNLVVSKKLQYGAALRRRTETAGDALIRCRAKEMLRLLDEVGKLAAFDYHFSLKVLDHMEVMPDGKLAVLFLSGIRLTI